jgi:hypothetical protein
MNLAMMPLIQVAALPRLMMRTPECLSLMGDAANWGDNRSCLVAAEQV